MDKAYNLKQQGFSVKEISKKLGIAQSTVHERIVKAERDEWKRKAEEYKGKAEEAKKENEQLKRKMEEYDNLVEKMPNLRKEKRELDKNIREGREWRREKGDKEMELLKLKGEIEIRRKELNDLYDQIFHCEHHFKKRANELETRRKEIERKENSVRRLVAEYRELLDKKANLWLHNLHVAALVGIIKQDPDCLEEARPFFYGLGERGKEEYEKIKKEIAAVMTKDIDKYFEEVSGEPVEKIK